MRQNAQSCLIAVMQQWLSFATHSRPARLKVRRKRSHSIQQATPGEHGRPLLQGKQYYTSSTTATWARKRRPRRKVFKLIHEAGTKVGLIVASNTSRHDVRKMQDDLENAASAIARGELSNEQALQRAQGVVSATGCKLRLPLALFRGAAREALPQACFETGGGKVGFAAHGLVQDLSLTQRLSDSALVLLESETSVSMCPLLTGVSTSTPKILREQISTHGPTRTRHSYNS